jgi:hypothetical protein
MGVMRRSSRRSATTSLVLLLTSAACADLLGIPEYRQKPVEAGGAAGGEPPMGGDAGTAGTSGTSGTSGTAGMAGAGPCGPATAEWNFDDGSVQGWAVHYGESEITGTELSGHAQVDEGLGTLNLTLEFDATVNTNAREQIFYAADAFDDAPIDFSGKTIFACVRVAERRDAAPDLPLINFFVESGVENERIDRTVRTNGFPLDPSGAWTTIAINLGNPPVDSREPFLEDDVRGVGLEIETGTTGSYGPIVVAVDAVWSEDSLEARSRQ